jgi:hypothetical protein
MEIKNYFVIQKWQRLYAQALQEDDRIKLTSRIAAAEREILHRYLELAAGSAPRTEERRDLRLAVRALSNAIEVATLLIQAHPHVERFSALK